MNDQEIASQKIILFDGVCNLCNGSVKFILQKEKEPVFQFASIQSEAGKKLLAWCGLPAEYSRAIILIERGKFTFGSTAALRIGQTLKFPWSFLARLGYRVPLFIRDRVYDQIAKHRYQWFGKQEFCMVPTPELQSRFLR
jgi:predicted DCC family thiol-disulfide oxidoreductase YuxK